MNKAMVAIAKKTSGQRSNLCSHVSIRELAVVCTNRFCFVCRQCVPRRNEAGKNLKCLAQVWLSNREKPFVTLTTDMNPTQPAVHI